jgi:hypothetical protein
MYFISIPVKLFIVGYAHAHKLLKVIITHYWNHVGRDNVQATCCPQHCDVYDICENKLTVGIICALFYRRLNQFHYIIKRCLFHKIGAACVIQIMILIIKCRSSNYNREFIIILCLNLLNKSLS